MRLESMVITDLAGPNPDDLLMTVYTDANGRFEVIEPQQKHVRFAKKHHFLLSIRTRHSVFPLADDKSQIWGTENEWTTITPVVKFYHRCNNRGIFSIPNVALLHL